jgi:D-alanyl-D-alanine carboxypeptidase (penicillin-binding protein 5/6)
MHPGAVLTVLTALVALVMGVGVAPATASGAPAPPRPTATGWLVADLDTGDVLAAQGEHTPLAPASTLKLLTAVALAPGLDPQQPYTATAEDAAIDGSKVGLDPGSVYRVQDVLHGLMLASGNDAAHALGELAGGQQAAVEAMQDVADSLGAEDTVVRNTSGLDADGQVSSAYDLALIGRAALADPQVAKLVGTRLYDFPAKGTTFGPERPTFQIANHNRLLFNTDGALGLKTGYTVAARHSYVGAIERDGHRYLVAMLHAEGTPWRQAGALLEWAATNRAAIDPVDTLEAAEPPAARDGERAGHSLSAELAAPVPDDLDAVRSPAAGPLSGLPTWLASVLVVLLVLALAVVALRTRVLLRRRRRRARRAYR